MARKRIADAKSRSLTIHFNREEDVALFDRLAQAADADFRRPVEQFILKTLHDQFPQQIADAGVYALGAFYHNAVNETADQKA